MGVDRRVVVLKAVAVVSLGFGLGYLLSYDPEAADERARIRQKERIWKESDREARRWARMSPAEREAERRAMSIAVQGRATAAHAERATRDSVERRRLDSLARVARLAACGRARVSEWSECRSATIGGRPYIVEMEIKGYNPGDPARRWIRVHDDSGRVVYQEDGSGAVDLSVRVLEDADGKARGLLFRRVPWTDSSRSSYHIVVPRGQLLARLSAPFNYGTIEETVPDRLRLLDGNRFFVGWQRRRYFNVHPAYRVDFGCATGAAPCIAPDSIEGLVSFPEVEIEREELEIASEAQSQPVDSTQSTVSVELELFPRPRAAKPELIYIPYGSTIEVLGAAGRMDGGEEARTDDWLHVRAKGRTGWIRGEHTAMLEPMRKQYVRLRSAAGGLR